MNGTPSAGATAPPGSPGVNSPGDASPGMAGVNPGPAAGRDWEPGSPGVNVPGVACPGMAVVDRMFSGRAVPCRPGVNVPGCPSPGTAGVGVAAVVPTVIDSGCVTVTAGVSESVTCTVKLVVPVPVGVPSMTP